MQTLVGSAVVVVALGAQMYLLVSCELWRVLKESGSWNRSAHLLLNVPGNCLSFSIDNKYH